VPYNVFLHVSYNGSPISPKPVTKLDTVILVADRSATALDADLRDEIAGTCGATDHDGGLGAGIVSRHGHLHPDDLHAVATAFDAAAQTAADWGPRRPTSR
jgi:hypothetical protein